MYFVLHLSKNLNYQTLKLTNNEIKVMNPVHALWGNNHLTSLDLRNNMVSSVFIQYDKYLYLDHIIMLLYET